MDGRGLETGCTCQGLHVTWSLLGWLVFDFWADSEACYAPALCLKPQSLWGSLRGPWPRLALFLFGCGRGNCRPFGVLALKGTCMTGWHSEWWTTRSYLTRWGGNGHDPSEFCLPWWAGSAQVLLSSQESGGTSLTLLSEIIICVNLCPGYHMVIKQSSHLIVQ